MRDFLRKHLDLTLDEKKKLLDAKSTEQLLYGYSRLICKFAKSFAGRDSYMDLVDYLVIIFIEAVDAHSDEQDIDDYFKRKLKAGGRKYWRQNNKRAAHVEWKHRNKKQVLPSDLEPFSLSASKHPGVSGGNADRSKKIYEEFKNNENAKLFDFLDSLDVLLKEIVICKLKGYSNRQVAKMLGEDEMYVRRKLKRARSALTLYLGEGYF